MLNVKICEFKDLNNDGKMQAKAQIETLLRILSAELNDDKNGG